MTSEGGAVSARDPRARLEEALADNASLRRHASSVAHDFNNLLAVITGYTEMMLRRLRQDDPLRRNAEAIKRATEWGAALAQQILAGSRRSPPAPTPVDLNQLVGNVTRVLQPLLGDNIELLTRLDSGLGRVSANPHQIGQVIMNLVVNARDAMPQGGRLTIETANVGQVVMLAVSDTGSGMDNETRAGLFEPYFTTKEPGRGSGVGLATVYRTLGWLAENGVVDTLSHNRGEACYRLCGDGHHHHLVCSGCHRVHGVGGAVGPDLSFVGDVRDADWLIRHFKDPQAVVPASIMPKFNLSDKELHDLTAYMLSLKKSG